MKADAIKNKVMSGDVIFATVISCGRTVFRATYGGVRSLDDVIAAVMRVTRNLLPGPATISLRNGTQGWTVNRMMRRTPVPEATQLTLW